MKRRKAIFAMVPARLGSTRLLAKNLAMLKGKPLIYYAIQAAKGAGIFERIILNSESPLFEKIANRYNVEFYKRPAEWATSNAKSDFVVYDFIKKNPCDILAWINPISPLQTGEEIRRITHFFLKKNLDSLITVKNENVHCVYKNKPINFRTNEIFAKTQNLIPVQPFVYSVMMWRTSVFMRTFEKKGFAFLFGKVGFYPVSRISSFIIKTKDDLMLADYVLRRISSGKKFSVKYDKIINKVNK